MSDFEIEGCFSEEAITKVLETFDGVDTLSTKQTDIALIECYPLQFSSGPHFACNVLSKWLVL